MRRPAFFRAAFKLGALGAYLAIASEIAQAQTSPITKGALTVNLSRVAAVATGTFGTPQDVVTAPDGTGRQFVATRNGDILTLTGGTLSPTPFLNMSSAGISIYTGGEGGLLEMAFSPTFNTPGTFGYEKFYTFATETFSTTGPAADFSHPELFPTTATHPNNQVVLREWSVPAPGSSTANTTSRVLMRINHPQSNHQGGTLRFGPDGNLYIGLGDGGGGNDFSGSAASTTDGHTNSTGNAQDTSVVFGKILRINPNPAAGAGFTASTNGQFSTPNTNPFGTGVGGLPEIYAYGLRNPYRGSFDPSTGKLYVGNVGQSNRESVVTMTNGGNYGWPYFEGTRDNQAAAGRTAPGGFTYTTPIAEYTHTDGEAIIGGEVYRGGAIPYLDGDYVFGDLGGLSGNTIGRLYYTPAAGGTISEFNYGATSLIPSANLYGYGIDPNGELEAFFSNGDILKFSAVPEPASLALLTIAGSFLMSRRMRKNF